MDRRTLLGWPPRQPKAQGQAYFPGSASVAPKLGRSGRKNWYFEGLEELESGGLVGKAEGQANFPWLTSGAAAFGRFRR